MLYEDELQINRIVQLKCDWESGLKWFQDLEEEGRKKVLQRLALCCYQAHPRPDEIPAAILLSGLKPTYTPCVLASCLPTNGSTTFAKIASLPENEPIKSFTLLIHILAIADGRRRATHCRNGCTHEWHNI
ncbi:MAG: hypothetical protein IPN71_02210 [Fibrobacteres bacterium]|nr:hypothetical protein [Fibrobacterota bacterium]